MPKKPPLSLVLPEHLHPAPPPELGERGRELWESIMHQYGIDDAGGQAILREACCAEDRAEKCRRIIDEQGEMITVRGQVRSHPLLRDELANRAFATRAIGRLGLDLEPVKLIGRPGGGAR